MLLTPNRELSVRLDLSGKDALHPFVERFLQFSLQRWFTERTAVGFCSLIHVTQHLQRVHHRIVVVSDMHLIPTSDRPKLRPSPILVLSTQQILHPSAKSVAVLCFASGLIKSSQEFHLHGRGTVVDSGIVTTFLLLEHLFALLVAHGRSHVDILGPATSTSLPQKHLVTDASCFLCLEELSISCSHLTSPIICPSCRLRHSHGTHQGKSQ